jgi:hypothetical protein
VLTIRPEQLKIFSQAEVQEFEDWVLAHLRRFFPRQCDATGEWSLRSTIQYGIQRAAVYGITDRRDVCKYIDLMVVFGRDFDTDQRLSWAGEILKKPRPPRTKMTALFETSKEHLGRR